MKTVIWSLALAGGLMAAMPAAYAQAEGAEKPRQERRGGGPGMNIEAMKEMLGLTDAQVEQLKPILAAQREEVAAKRKELGEDADRAKVREAMQAIREKYKTQIDAVLTAEQKEKLAKGRERGQGQGGQGGQGGPGGQGGEGRKAKKGGTDAPPAPPSE